MTKKRMKGGPEGPPPINHIVVIEKKVVMILCQASPDLREAAVGLPYYPMTSYFQEILYNKRADICCPPNFTEKIR